MKKIVAACILFLCILLGFFFIQRKGQNKEIAQVPRCQNCNVVFIGIDALQASHVHSLGYSRNTTPNFDNLVKKGYLFSNAISPASWTVPTYMSIFTSTYPSVNKMVNRYVEYSKTKSKLSNINELSPNIVTLAQEFKKHGYITGGFTGDAGVGKPLGYDRGFDTYTDEVRFGGMENSQQHALKWLDENKEKKFFMFFHGYDTHGQFALAENYHSIFEPKNYKGLYKGTAQEQGKLREQGLSDGFVKVSDDDADFWRAWYDGKIVDADKRLGEFIDALNKRGILNKTVFVIFSDHGTEFFEHNRVDHGHTLYDELIHVPLAFIIPGQRSGKVIPAQVSTMQIAPTVFDIVHIVPSKEYLSQIQGSSLFSYLENPNQKGEDVYSETDYRDYTHKRAIRTKDGWKYIITLENDQEELYDLNTDKGEINNLINVETEMADKLRKKLQSHLQKDLHFDSNTKFTTGCLPAYPDQCK